MCEEKPSTGDTLPPFIASLFRRHHAPPQLKDRGRNLFRLDQADAEDADGVGAGGGQGEGGGERCSV